MTAGRSSKHDARWRAATLAVALAVPLFWAILSPPGASDLVGGDEGYYGTMARNILADPRQLLGPALTPLGPPGDKPPLYPALLALAVRVGGVNAASLRWPSFLFAALTLLGTGALVRRTTKSAPAGFAAALLTGSVAFYADASRVVAAELLVTALGVGALLLFEREPLSNRRAFAGGVLLGLAFLTKLWFASLFGLAVLLRLAPFRAPLRLAAAALGFALAGGAQLAAVALFAPSQLSHWLGVYWAFSLAGRASGDGFASYWRQPADFYVTLLGRALLAQMPLLALGVAWAARHFERPGVRLLVGWALGLALLSAFAVKSGAYASPLVPAFAALAALGAYGAATRFRHVATMLVALAAVAGLVHTAFRLKLVFHDTGYAVAARALAPVLASAPPTKPVLVAAEAPTFGYLLFRTGGYWGTPYRPWTAACRESIAADTAIRAFVVADSGVVYGGWPDRATIAWLEANTHEITDSIGARRHAKPLRVFVRR